MYKVFLVDDEIAIREGIRNSHIWQSGRFVLSGEAADGEIAYPMIRDEEPDILVTDVKMPFMDGIELCRQVRRSMPWIQVVILSGYDNFSYAQQAIRLGVQEYLLKPVSSAKLLTTLEKLADRIEQEQQEDEEQQKMRRSMSESRQIIRDHLLGSLLQTSITQAEGERIIEQLRKIGMNVMAKCYAVIEIRQADREAGYEPIRQALARFQQDNSAVYFLCGNERSLNAFVLGDREEDLEERAYSLAIAFQHELDCQKMTDVTLSIGKTVFHFHELFDSYCSARHARHIAEAKKIPIHKRRIIGSRDVHENNETGTKELKNEEFNSLYNMMKYAERDEIEEKLAQYVMSLGEQVTPSAEYLRVETLLAASRIIQDAQGSPQEVIKPEWLNPERVLSGAYLQDYMGTAVKILESAIDYRDENSGLKGNRIVNKAKLYLQKHYMESQLTFQDVISYVAMSSSHFSTVFAQSVGKTFTQYLTDLRLDKAKELLVKTNMRSSEIAYAVGYNDPHYFSYLFKKNVGITPGGYRTENTEPDKN